MEGVIGKTGREEVDDDDDAELSLFPDLKSLYLRDLPMLEMFSSGSLRTLDIAGCPKWKIFHKAPISDAKSIEISNFKTSEGSFFHQKVKVPSLKELHISEKEVEMLRDGILVLRNLTKLSNFDNVRYLFSRKLIEEIVVRDVEDDEKVDKLVLPQLETLIVRKLENLKWFFHEDLDFPSLVNFEFDECPRMEVLCCGLVLKGKKCNLFSRENQIIIRYLSLVLKGKKMYNQRIKGKKSSPKKKKKVLTAVF
ncbi:hypothetical protein M9H77_28714 [Catharanthus roseus]|uniref:Uncharacterized protein n=1 Tax=Catharanthus roseus TaxID=4058 RepID=A0ACC0AGR6_CATRO|nr:hypothetical protein M9H77_28714 [Catharanthus roseus]